MTTTTPPSPDTESRHLIAAMWDMGAAVNVECRDDGHCRVRLIGNGIKLTASSSGYANAVRYAHRVLTAELAKGEREVAA